MTSSNQKDANLIQTRTSILPISAMSVFNFLSVVADERLDIITLFFSDLVLPLFACPSMLFLESLLWRLCAESGLLPLCRKRIMS